MPEVKRMDKNPEEKPRRKRRKTDKPIPYIYGAIDNDLARDNLENHLPYADVEDLTHANPEASGEDF